MTYEPYVHRRRSIRVRNYDYAQAGIYFVTVCTWKQRSLFGKVLNNKMHLNDAGQIVATEWLRTPRLRPQIELDEFVVMPNHLHGILVILSGSRRGVLQYAPTPDATNGAPQQPFRSPSQTIGAIVRGFKAAVTKRINNIQDIPVRPVWQRNYYEHIICNGAELDQTRRYIRDNPAVWEQDENNPNKCLP